MEKDPGGCCTRLLARVCPPFFKEELKSTLKIGWAIVATQFLAITFQATAVMFGGHLGKEELATIALSVTLVNCLGNSIVVGLSTCCDTVFSQSFGNGEYKMVGIYLQRSLYIHVLGMLPCYAIHLNIESILLAVGQDPKISEQTGRYLLYFMPGLMCLCLFTVIRKYTQAQNVVIPHIFILLSGHAVHAVCQYLFLYYFKIGIVGSAIAQDIAYFYILMVTIIFTLCSKAHKQSWPGWDVRGLMEWGPLARLAVFGLMMVTFEWWSFEISIFVAGYLGKTELGSQSATFHMDTLYNALIFGMGVATTIRIGQLLGAGEPTRAKTAVFVGFVIIGVQSSLVAIIYGSARYQLPRLFTDDEGVIDQMAGILPVLAIYVLMGAINMAGRAAFRGMGWQRLGSAFSFVSFYVCAWPVALPLTLLTSLGIIGIWWGFVFGITVSAIAYIISLVCFADWEKLSQEAIALAKAKQSPYGKDGAETVKVSEKTPILAADELPATQSYNGDIGDAAQPTGGDLGSMPSINHSQDEKATISVTKHLIMTRVLTVLIFLLIVGVGIIVRFSTRVWVEEKVDQTAAAYNGDLNQTTAAYREGFNETTYDWLNH